ncbi:MAG: LysR substrate-binding domain-containing protein [Kofleriaceae bacterium]
MNQLESLRAFVTAVDAGSLSAAARELAMPLPTLSRKVADLERHLGTALLVRTSRRLAISEAGQAYVTTARRLLEELAEADRAARGEYQEPRGELAIAAPLVFGRLHVLPIVAELLREYPDIRVRLVLSDRYANLVEDRLDVAVRIGDLPDTGLVALRVGSVRRVACASPAYFETQRRPRRPADLSRHACIAFEATPGSTVEWRFAEDTVTIRPRLAVTTADAAIDAAIAGLGIVRVLSYQSRVPERDHRLQRVLASFEPPALPVQLVRAGVQVPRKVRAFLDLAATRLKPILDR